MNTQCEIAGFTIRRTKADVVVRFLKIQMRKRRHIMVFFANSNFVNRCMHLRQVIAETPNLLILNDGVAIDIASFLRFGAFFPENLNGTDLTWTLLSELDRKTSLFLLGSRQDVVESAAKVFGQLPHIKVVGCVDGYSIWADEAAVIQRVQQAEPDILLVALGNPIQEEWVLRNRTSLETPLMVSVGGLFDFVSGNKPRAPKVLRVMRLEWAYRLALEPRRLLARYTIEILRFFAAVFIGSGKS